MLANSSKYGVEAATAWAKGLTPDALTTKLNGLAKQGQFAINFSDFALPSVAAGSAPGAAFTKTVNRQTVDAATSKIIGSGKIPTPAFDGTSIDTVFNSNISGQAGSLLNGVKGGIPGIGNLSSIGGLTGASKLPSLATPGFAGALGTSGVNTIGTNTTDPSVNSAKDNYAARKAAIEDMELKKGIYEVAKAEYGISSPQAQEAFAAYKALQDQVRPAGDEDGDEPGFDGACHHTR